MSAQPLLCLPAGSEPEYRDKVTESSTFGCGGLDKLSISSELDGKCRLSKVDAPESSTSQKSSITSSPVLLELGPDSDDACVSEALMDAAEEYRSQNVRSGKPLSTADTRLDWHDASVSTSTCAPAHITSQEGVAELRCRENSDTSWSVSTFGTVSHASCVLSETLSVTLLEALDRDAAMLTRCADWRLDVAAQAMSPHWTRGCDQQWWKIPWRSEPPQRGLVPLAP